MPTSNFKIFVKLKLCFILFSTIIFINCSSADEDQNTVYSYRGPGSSYSMTLNVDAGTFLVNESDCDLVVNGTYELLSSGFTELTVTSATSGSSEGCEAPSSGSKAYGIDVPGYVFLLKPIEEDSSIIPMIASGTCPVDDFTANWIVTSIEEDAVFENDCLNPDGNGLDVLGIFSYTHTPVNASLPSRYDICGADLGAGTDDIDSFTCSDGLASVGDATLYLTQSGGMIVNINEDSSDDSEDEDKIIIALPSQSITDMTTLDGDYIGLVLSQDSSTKNVFPISATFNTDSFTFSEINPINGDEVLDNDVKGTTYFSAADTPTTGFIDGTYNLDSDSGTDYEIICNTSVNIFSSGKNFLFCIGQTPNEDDLMFNALLVSKN